MKSVKFPKTKIADVKNEVQRRFCLAAEKYVDQYKKLRNRSSAINTATVFGCICSGIALVLNAVVWILANTPEDILKMDAPTGIIIICVSAAIIIFTIASAVYEYKLDKKIYQMQQQIEDEFEKYHLPASHARWRLDEYVNQCSDKYKDLDAFLKDYNLITMIPRSEDLIEAERLKKALAELADNQDVVSLSASSIDKLGGSCKEMRIYLEINNVMYSYFTFTAYRASEFAAITDYDAIDLTYLDAAFTEFTQPQK